MKPSNLISQCELNVSDRINQKRLSVLMQGDLNDEVVADPVLLLHAVQLVLDNAVKYAVEGTVIEVALKRAENRMTVDIANDGEKIADDYLEGIFDVFFVQNVDRHHRGHGLSLAIARRITEAHGGTLSAHNHDKGPLFRFEI